MNVGNRVKVRDTWRISPYPTEEDTGRSKRKASRRSWNGRVSLRGYK